MSPSASYEMGLHLGERLFSKLDTNSMWSKVSPTCMDRVSEDLNQQLKLSVGFQPQQQLLAQITDLDKRQKICRSKYIYIYKYIRSVSDIIRSNNS